LRGHQVAWERLTEFASAASRFEQLLIVAGRVAEREVGVRPVKSGPEGEGGVTQSGGCRRQFSDVLAEARGVLRYQQGTTLDKDMPERGLVTEATRYSEGLGGGLEATLVVG
jgi:hypothetical protein